MTSGMMGAGMRRGLKMGVFALVLGGLVGAAQAETLRPAIGNPLKQAKALLASRSYAKALAAVRQADAVPGKTPQEELVIEEMRAAIANSSGDNATAVQSYTFLINSPAVAEARKLALMQALVGVEIKQHNYAQAASWAEKYFRAGGSDAQVRTAQIDSYYFAGDYANAVRLLLPQVDAARRHGAPSEEQLPEQAGPGGGGLRHHQAAGDLLPEAELLAERDCRGADQAELRRPAEF